MCPVTKLDKTQSVQKCSKMESRHRLYQFKEARLSQFNKLSAQFTKLSA